MSKNYDSERQNSVASGKPKDALDMGDETPPGTVVEEPVYKEEKNTAKPSMRSNVSSFAAPTKASEAKKNEKIELAAFVKQPDSTKELPSRQGSVMRQHSAFGLDNRRTSLHRRPAPTSARTRDHDAAVDRSLSSAESQVATHPRTRSGSLSSIISDRPMEDEGNGAEEEESPVLEDKDSEKIPLEKILTEQETRRDELQAEEEPLGQEEKQLGDVEEVLTSEEPLEHRVEESRAEHEGLHQQRSNLTKGDDALTLQEDYVKSVGAQVVTSQDQLESMSLSDTKVNGEDGAATIIADTDDVILSKVIAKKEELQAELEEAEKQRDEAIRQHEIVLEDLQAIKEDAEKLKQEHDKLSTQLRESEARIAARNAREPGLPFLEAAEAENEKLRVAVEDTRLELEKKEKELSDVNACCAQFDDQLRETQEKLKTQETSIKELCELVDQVVQNLSQVAKCEATELDELFQSLTQDTGIGQLRAEFLKLIKTSNENFKESQCRNEDLERQIAEERFEVSSLKKAMDIQKAELLSPDLQSPLGSPGLQLDRSGFEQYYKQERLKCKGVEQELAQAKKLLSKLRPENEQLQLNLAKAQEELAILRPKVDTLEKETKGWKEDSEEKKSQLEKRTRAFETNLAQQKQESLRYAKNYYNKVKDEAHWDVQGLQNKLATSEREREALARAFEQTKVENVRLQDAVTRLRKAKKAREVHIGKMEEAIMRNTDFPILSPTTSHVHTPHTDTSSPSSASTISSLVHPSEITNTPPPIPRCHFPSAIQARGAKLTAYQQELEKAREQNTFGVNIKLLKSNGPRPNEIMEKVRKWKMGASYAPEKPGWGKLKRKSAWERWEGDVWAMDFAKGKDVDFLRKMGLWDETWV